MFLTENLSARAMRGAEMSKTFERMLRCAPTTRLEERRKEEDKMLLQRLSAKGHADRPTLQQPKTDVIHTRLLLFLFSIVFEFCLLHYIVVFTILKLRISLVVEAQLKSKRQIPEETKASSAQGSHDRPRSC